MKNKHVELLVELLDMPLKGSARRKRNRIQIFLLEKAKELEENRKLLLEENAIKDEKGELIAEDGKHQFTKEKKLIFEKEFDVLINEELKDFIPEEIYLKKVLNKIDKEQEFNTQKGILFDEILDEL